MSKKQVHALDDPRSVRYKLRRKRSVHLFGLVKHILETKKDKVIKICDLGGTYRYWKVFPFHELPDVTFEIDLVNIMERRFKNIESFPNVVFNSKIGDGCNMINVSDNEYDICHSNSVIEHVGDWKKIHSFVQESKRIGRFYYIQTPNYWFPIEPHYMLPFIHFLPRPIHTRLLMLLKKLNFDRATAKFDENRMLSKKEFKFLFPESKYHTEWYILPKSYVAISNY